MRFLVDNCVSPKVARHLCDLGHDARHALDVGMASADDEDLFALAAREDRVVISADEDFNDLLFQTGAIKPSVILLQAGSPTAAAGIVALLRANLPQLTPYLKRGALVVVRADRLRIRNLPLFQST